MQKFEVSAITVLLLLMPSSFAQDRRPFVLLPANTAHQPSHLCSRQGLAHVDGGWSPTAAEIDLVESRLERIAELPSSGESEGIQISQPRRYYRQYIPVVVQRRRLIYLNAFSEKPPASWQTRLVDICDTGSESWGVLYDPQTGQFSQLRTNGVIPPPLPPPPGC